MLRYDRQTKPGLVALYDIWPGNVAGLFLQPRACTGRVTGKAIKNSHQESPKILLWEVFGDL